MESVFGEEGFWILRWWGKHHGVVSRFDAWPGSPFNGLAISCHHGTEWLGEASEQVKSRQRRHHDGGIGEELVYSVHDGVECGGGLDGGEHVFCVVRPDGYQHHVGGDTGVHLGQVVLEEIPSGDAPFPGGIPTDTPPGVPVELFRNLRDKPVHRIIDSDSRDGRITEPKKVEWAGSRYFSAPRFRSIGETWFLCSRPPTLGN